MYVSIDCISDHDMFRLVSCFMMCVSLTVAQEADYHGFLDARTTLYIHVRAI